MIIFKTFYLIRKSERHRKLYLVIVLVLTVTTLAVACEKLHRGQRLFTCYLCNIIGDTILIIERLFFKRIVLTLYTQDKCDIRVYYSLLFQNVLKIFVLNFYISENFKVRSPMCLCTCLFLLCFFLFKTTNVSSLFKVQVILISVTENLDVHKLR